VRPLLITLAAGALLIAACSNDDSVDRAELEARDAAEQAEEHESQIEASEEDELRQELEDLREQLEADEGVGGAADGGDTGGGNTGGNNARVVYIP
jgi:ABC-type phosphate/phosphonate transport system substrate-binding protein